jgi:O-antigen/teichoic acid export membrane protein
MTKLWAERDETGFIRVYRNATQLVAVIAIPAAMMLSFYAEPILWAWTGDITISQSAAPVLSLYALGNGILALGAFPYFLQYAKGNLHLHVIGNFLFVALLIPSVIWATQRYGVRGAGYAWLSANAIYFIFWVPVVHSRLLKGLHVSWLFRDVAPTLLLSLFGIGLLHIFFVIPTERIDAGVFLIVAGIALLILGSMASAPLREAIRGGLRLRTTGHNG